MIFYNIITQVYPQKLKKKHFRDFIMLLRDYNSFCFSQIVQKWYFIHRFRIHQFTICDIKVTWALPPWVGHKIISNDIDFKVSSMGNILSKHT